MPRQILSQNKLDEIVAIAAIGCSRRVAAERSGYTEDDLHETTLQNPEFAARLGEAEHRTEIGLINRIHDAAKEEKNWRAAAWALERINSDDFGRRRPDTITRKQCHDIRSRLVTHITQDVTDEKLRESLIQHANEAFATGDEI